MQIVQKIQRTMAYAVWRNYWMESSLEVKKGLDPKTQQQNQNTQRKK